MGKVRSERMNFLSRCAPSAVSRRSFQSKKLDAVRIGMLVHLSETEFDGSDDGIDIVKEVRGSEDGRSGELEGSRSESTKCRGSMVLSDKIDDDSDSVPIGSSLSINWK